MREINPRDTLSSIVAGITAGTLLITYAVSLAAMVFSGELGAFAGRGIGFALLSATVLCGVAVCKSSLPGMLMTPQDSPAVIMAAVGVSLTASLATVTGATEHAFYTTVACMLAASLLTGVIFWTLGALKLGGLVRYLPYPVIGGFLAGTGWLMIVGSVAVMSGVTATLDSLSELIQTNTLIRWLPGVAIAVLLLGLARAFSHVLITLGVLLGAAGFFYLLLFSSGGSIAEAEAGGWLLGPFPEGGIWEIPEPSALSKVSWQLVLEQWGNLLSIVVVSAVTLLLYVSALEVTLRRNIDLNQELRSAGVANLISGLVGAGMVGFQTIAFTSLAHKVGAGNRRTSLVASLLCLAALLFGPTLLSLVPRIVLGGMLLYIGMDFLLEYAYETRKRLSLVDYLIVLIILGVIALFGFLYGVATGLVISVAVFIVTYSRTNVVRHAMTGAERHSNVDRAGAEERILERRGDEIEILEMQGFIFFGTANGLWEKVRARSEVPPSPPRFVVMDFRLVTGIDASAILSFMKIKQLGETVGFRMVLTGLTDTVRGQLGASEFGDPDEDGCRTFSDLDHGLEWCEDTLLQESDLPRTTSVPLIDQLREVLPESTDLESLESCFERRELQRGERLITQDEPVDALYIIESGRVTVQIELENGTLARLRSMGPGTVLGELALLLGTRASASVTTDEPSVLYRLSADGLARITRDSPDVAAALQRYLALRLAERLRKTNTTLTATLH